MNIFKKIFGSSPEENKSEVIAPVMTSEETPATMSDNEPSDKEEQSELKAQIYTISYGTHMAIDAIYMFLDKSFEDVGYKDAMCSVDSSYKESGERLIRNELKILFRRVTLRYKEDQRSLSSTIRMVREQGLLDQALALESKMETVNEHMEELLRMETGLDNNDSSMMRPIESYSRGFLKGLTAKTKALLNDK